MTEATILDAIHAATAVSVTEATVCDRSHDPEASCKQASSTAAVEAEMAPNTEHYDAILDTLLPRANF